MTVDSVAALRRPSAGGRPATAPVRPMLRAQAKAQARIFLRTPTLSFTGLLMPIMLFAFFVLPHAREPWQGSISLGAYMLASIGAYAVSSVMVFNFGVGVAIERGQKVDLLMGAMPLPGWLYLAARTVVALAFGAAAMTTLFVVAAGPGGIALEPTSWLSLAGRLMVGSVPFIGFGLAVAFLASPTSAPAIANLAFIGLAFASGMFVPLDQMPDVVRSVAPVLPTYHYAQLAWGAIGAADEGALTSMLWLAGYAIVFLGLAAWGWRREAARSGTTAGAFSAGRGLLARIRRPSNAAAEASRA
jgi:ABC-2 type transport system permease protein